MKRTLFIILLLVHLIGFTQSKKQLLQIANKAYTLNDYYSAINLYQGYLEEFPDEIEVEFKLAKSYIELNDFEKAIEPLNHIYKIDRDRKFPETSLLLANAYKQTANYRYAKRYFRRALIKFRRQKDSFEYKKINQEIKSSDFAQANYSKQNNKDLTNLGSSINSTNADFAFAQVDSSNGIFAATDTFGTNEGTIAYSKLFWAVKNNDQWKRTNLIVMPIEYAQKNIVNPFYDGKNKQLFFSDCDTLHQCEIKVGDLINGELTNISALNNKINLPNTNNTQPAIAYLNSDRYLLFSSNRFGGQGGMDIWYSKYTSNGFQDPVNIGTEVNSPDHEITPFYTSKTLYFSSNWHNGFGGFDVFKSEGNLKKQAIVENLSQPINSISNDLYFRIYEDFAYLTTNRTGSMTFKNDNCCNDLYSFPITTENSEKEVNETYESINSFLPLTLYFDNDLPKKNETDTTTDANFVDLLDQYKSKKDIYLSQNLKGLRKDEALDTEDEVLDFFDFQLPHGKKQLEEIKNFINLKLSDSEDINLIIRGYSSALANSDYNFKLSQRRINSVYNYFKSSSISVQTDGKLNVISLPLGDLISTENKLDIKKNKVYGLDAVYQRKIEIVGLTGSAITKDNNESPELTLPNPIINLGKIKPKAVNYSLTIQNTGNADLELIKIVGADLKGNIIPQLIIPNESTTIELKFDFLENNDSGSSTIYFITNEIQKLKSIEFRFQLID